MDIKFCIDVMAFLLVNLQRKIPSIDVEPCINSLLIGIKSNTKRNKKRVDYYHDFEHLQVIEYRGEPRKDKIKNRIAYATYNHNDGKLWWMGKSYVQEKRNNRVNLEKFIQDVRREWGEEPSLARNAPKNCKTWFEDEYISTFEYRKIKQTRKETVLKLNFKS